MITTAGQERGETVPFSEGEEEGQVKDETYPATTTKPDPSLSNPTPLIAPSSSVRNKSTEQPSGKVDRTIQTIAKLFLTREWKEAFAQCQRILTAHALHPCLSAETLKMTLLIYLRIAGESDSLLLGPELDDTLSVSSSVTPFRPLEAWSLVIAHYQDCLANVPAELLVVGLLLHLKHRAFEEAKADFEDWLEAQPNTYHEQVALGAQPTTAHYERLVEVYTAQILVRLHEYGRALDYLEGNTFLSPGKRAALIRQVMECQRAVLNESKKSSSCECSADTAMVHGSDVSERDQERSVVKETVSPPQGSDARSPILSHDEVKTVHQSIETNISTAPKGLEAEEGPRNSRGTTWSQLMWARLKSHPTIKALQTGIVLLRAKVQHEWQLAAQDPQVMATLMAGGSVVFGIVIWYRIMWGHRQPRQKRLTTWWQNLGQGVMKAIL